MSDIPAFTLQRLVETLIGRRWVAAGIVAASLLGGVIYLHASLPTYTVEMQVIAAAGEETITPSALGASAALLSQLGGGRASTAYDNFELYLAGVKSIETARTLSQRPDIMQRVFASEWSVKDHSWRRPFSLPGAVMRFTKGILGIYVPPWQPPDAKRLQEFLDGNIFVSRSVVTPVVTVSIQTADRQFGVELLNAVHDAVDGMLRRRTLARTGSYIQYLTGLLPGATVVEYRSALAETIMQQEKVRMTAASSVPYAADIFAKPTPSRTPTSPRGTLILFLSTMAGLMLAIAEAVIFERLGAYRRFWKGQSRATASPQPPAS